MEKLLHVLPTACAGVLTGTRGAQKPIIRAGSSGFPIPFASANSADDLPNQINNNKITNAMNSPKQPDSKLFKLLVVLVLLSGFACYRANAQSVGISSSAITPDASSILEMRTNSKGLLIPRMTTTERDAISSPATGLEIYNTTTNKFNFYNGSSWIVLFSGSTGVNSITGTSNRISIGGTSTDPTIDISSSYVGQSSITTLGTVGTGSWNGTLIDPAYGGTGNSTYSVGDMLYASGATTLSKLADAATGNVLISGGASTAPLWGKIGLTTHVSGTLPVANGGTGATSLTGLLKGNGTSAFTAATAGTDYSAGTSALATGILKSTTTTGALSIAVAGDFPTLNQNTTGSAATLTTSRNIYGTAFNGSADVTGIIASTYGGTGNGFAKFSGPATSEKTFTLPNTSATILTDNAAVTVAQGGTGQSSYTDGQLLIGNSTGNTLTKSTLTAGTGISITNAGGSITITNSAPSTGGTVTSVAALTLGTTGTDLSSSVATGTTTPVITLNVPTASSSNRGVLSTADWSTFNGKENALTFSTGLTRTTNTITVNTSQNISTLSNLTSNGLIKTSGGTGALSIATAGSDYSAGTSALATGILKSTTTTGALTIAIAGDFPTLNQNTTGSAATLTTARAIYGNNFDGSAALTQVIASTYGGTGNGFAKLSGPATSEKTFTLPNASATILTDNTDVTVAQGGTGVSSTTAYGVITGGTTSTGALQNAGTGTTGQILTSNGSAALPTWQTGVAGTLQSMQIIASGTTSYVKPAGITSIFVVLVGAGGQGGGTVATTGPNGQAVGGGGGSGSLVQKYITGLASASATYTCSVGAGASGTHTGTGASGASTTITVPVGGTLYTAPGGSGGLSSGNVNNTAEFTLGGAGGAAGTNGDTNGAGSPGAYGWEWDATHVISGTGASSQWGGGGNSVIITGNNNSSAGNSATGYGSGGGGAASIQNATTRSGGSGGDGVIIVYEYK